MIKLIGVLLLVLNILSAWMFWTWFNKLITWISQGCYHSWLDTTVPFSDYTGGWHICTKCKERKYIKWGWWYQREQSLGRIAHDDKRADQLTDEFTGFSKLLNRSEELQ
jgi:hypothetical protein